MRVFDGRKASDDYMSTHTLAFSTPELTLKRFAFWLADMVPDPQDKKSSIPRLDTYVDEKDFEPVQVIDDDTYTPTGAVRSSLYGDPSQDSEKKQFCGECGTSISQGAKFCPNCGTPN